MVNNVYFWGHNLYLPGRVAQSVMCLATDVCLTADPGVASSIPARCNRPEFPPSQFFPRGKNGPAHSFPGGNFGLAHSFPTQSVFSPLIIFKNHNTYLFFFNKLECRYSITNMTRTFCCFVVIWRVGKDWAGPFFPPLEILFIFQSFGFSYKTLMNELF